MFSATIEGGLEVHRDLYLYNMGDKPGQVLVLKRNMNRRASSTFRVGGARSSELVLTRVDRYTCS